MGKLIHENRVKIPCTNTKVFGHGGNPEQVRNEVYDWLAEFAPTVPGIGAQWAERTYKEPVAKGRPISTGYRPTPHRPFSAPFGRDKVAGKYFYFADKKLAMLFKLTWAGK